MHHYGAIKKITPKDGTLTFGVLDACCNWFLKLLLRGALEGEAGFPEAFGGGFDGDFARGASALDYGGELAAEKVHPGLVERFCSPSVTTPFSGTFRGIQKMLRHFVHC